MAKNFEFMSPALQDLETGLANAWRESAIRGLIGSAEWALQLIYDISKGDGKFAELQACPPLSLQHALALSHIHSRTYEQIEGIFPGNATDTDPIHVFLLSYAAIMLFDRTFNDRVALSGPSEISMRQSDHSRQFCKRHLDVVNASLKQNPNDAYLCLLKSMLHFRSQQHNDALQSIVRAIEIEPCCFAMWDQLRRVSAHVQDSEGLVRRMCDKKILCSQFLCLYLAATTGVLHSSQPIEEYMHDTDCADGPSVDGEADIDTSDIKTLALKCAFGVFCTSRVLFTLRRYDEAKAVVVSFHERSPPKVHVGADVLSDIYFLDEDVQSIVSLAGQCQQLSPYHPVTCYVQGNLYAIRKDHQRAAVSFMRATRLDPEYGAAWMLLGQQYVELRQPEAAIDAFRSATEAAPLDYRGWFGLGQIYELCDSLHMSLEYYTRASQLEGGSSDPRVHECLGDCYFALGNYTRALTAYTAAEACIQRNKFDRESSAGSLQRYRPISQRQCASVYSKIAKAYAELTQFDNQSDDYGGLGSKYAQLYLCTVLEDGAIPVHEVQADSLIASAAIELSMDAHKMAQTALRARLRDYIVYAAEAVSDLDEGLDLQSALERCS